MYVLLNISEQSVTIEKQNKGVLWKITGWAWMLCMGWKMPVWASSWVETDVNQLWDKPKGNEVSIFLLLMELLVFLHTPGLVLSNVCCPNLVLSKTLLILLLHTCHIFCVLHKCLWIDLHSVHVKIRGSIHNLLYLWNCAT